MKENNTKEKKKSNIIIRMLLRIIGVIALIPIALFSIVLACDIAISSDASGHIYSNIKEIPHNKHCIVLGTTPYRKGYKNGNPYFYYRMDAAAELYKQGKTDHIIVSGDSSKNYDEPSMMRRALMKRGVPKRAITRDTKGQGTLESMKQAKEHFGLEKFTVVSQQFQNERAIFIANHYGLNVTGYNAKDINVEKGYRVYFREKLARIKVFIEILTGR